MDKRAKKRWVKNLRSGKFQQGTGALHSTEENGVDVYCCLGVLCRTSAKVKARNVYGDDVVYEEDGTTSSSILPRATRLRLGISDYEQDHLANMNDNGRATFDDIADWIEVNL